MDRLGDAREATLDLERLRRRLARTAPGMPGESEDERRIAWTEVARIAHQGRSRFLSDLPAFVDPASESEAPDQLGEALLALVDTSRSEVTIVSAYLIPTERAEKAIEAAEARGVRVRLLTNSLRSNNHLAAHSAYRNHVHRLISHGAELHETRALGKDRARYMLPPSASKRLGLHAKAVLFDDDLVYRGSCNLDPRSLRLNTEFGLVVESRDFNRAVWNAIEVDFHGRNAWPLRPAADGGGIEWVGDDQILQSTPADGPMRALEDWFLSLVPIENEM